MYESFFGLKETPFSIAPDPRYLYMSERHKEALAHLLYGLEREGGFVLLTGEVGTGKTTICRRFIQSVPANTELAFILYPKLTGRELLATICDELQIVYPVGASTKVLVDLINKHLLQAHASRKHTALIIDEAQNLSSEVLEQLRLLTNLETDNKKLLQIILLGQPELNELLQRPDLRQLSQRITARYHLGELSFEDFKGYIRFRLNKAGCHQDVFTATALRKLYRASKGIPRLINLISDRAMLGAYATNSTKVTASHIRSALKEIGQTAPLAGLSALFRHWITKGAIAGVFSGLAALALVYYLVKPVDQETALVASAAFNPEVEKPLASQPEAIEMDDKVDHSAAPVTEVSASQVLASATEGGSDEVSGSDEEGEQNQAFAAPVQVTSQPSDAGTAWLLQESPGNSFGMAFRAIGQRWAIQQPDITLDDRSALCEWAARFGLGCLQREGNWRSLLQLNRPAIVRLLLPDGRQLFVPLLSLRDGNRVRVSLGAEQRWLSLQDIDQFWQGEYHLLWKLPPYNSRLITPGATVDKEAWISSRLELLDSLLSGEDRDGLSQVSANGATDTQVTFAERVRRFQEMAGIQPDGIPGTNTLIMLNTWTDPDVPLLQDQTES